MPTPAASEERADGWGRGECANPSLESDGITDQGDTAPRGRAYMEGAKERADSGGRVSMVHGDERDARLKHQSLFLHARGLVSAEMADINHQLRLRARLAGKDSSKLDPHVLDRFQGELERAAMEQLRTTGLLEEWLESWETRSDSAHAPVVVPRQKNPHLPARHVDRAPTATVDRTPARTSLADKLAKFEYAVQMFSEHLADFELRVKQARTCEHV